MSNARRSTATSRRLSFVNSHEKVRIGRLKKSISGMMDRGSRDEEVRCPITDMTIKEKEMLHSSWSRVYGLTDAQRKASGIKMLSWLLDHVPHMKERILLNQTEPSEDPPVLTRRFNRLSIAVPNTIDDMIRHLKEPLDFHNYLGNIARYHINLEPPVTVQHFKDFEAMFPVYVQALLELSPAAPEIQLWKKLLALLTRRVQHESVAAGLDTKPKGGCCVIL